MSVTSINQHRPRRATLTKSSLLSIGRQRLRTARNTSVGLSSQDLCGDQPGQVRHIVVAMRAAYSLDLTTAPWPPGSTVHVLQGVIHLRDSRASTFCWPGDLMVVPATAEHLLANCDAVLLVSSVVEPNVL